MRNPVPTPQERLRNIPGSARGEFESTFLRDLMIGAFLWGSAFLFVLSVMLASPAAHAAEETAKEPTREELRALLKSMTLPSPGSYMGPMPAPLAPSRQYDIEEKPKPSDS